jgi:hypothetical protein
MSSFPGNDSVCVITLPLDDASDLIDLIVNQNHLGCLPWLIMHNYSFFKGLKLPLLSTLLHNRRGFKVPDLERTRFYFWEVNLILKKSGDFLGLSRVSQRVPTSAYYNSMNMMGVKHIRHEVGDSFSYRIVKQSVSEPKELEITVDPFEDVLKKRYQGGSLLFLAKHNKELLKTKLEPIIDEVKDTVAQCKAIDKEISEQIEDIYSKIPGRVTFDIVSTHNNVEICSGVRRAMKAIHDFCIVKSKEELACYLKFKEAMLKLTAGGQAKRHLYYPRALKAEKEFSAVKKFMFLCEHNLEWKVEQVMGLQDNCDKEEAASEEAARARNRTSFNHHQMLLKSYSQQMTELDKYVSVNYELREEGGFLIDNFNINFDSYFDLPCEAPLPLRRAVVWGKEDLAEIMKKIVACIKDNSVDDNTLARVQIEPLKQRITDCLVTGRRLIRHDWTLESTKKSNELKAEIMECRQEIQRLLSNHGGAEPVDLVLVERQQRSLLKTKVRLQAGEPNFIFHHNKLKNRGYGAACNDHNIGIYFEKYAIPVDLSDEEWLDRAAKADVEAAKVFIAKFEKWCKKFTFYTGISPWGHIIGKLWKSNTRSNYNEGTGRFYNFDLSIFNSIKHNINDAVLKAMDVINPMITKITSNDGESSLFAIDFDRKMFGKLIDQGPSQTMKDVKVFNVTNKRTDEAEEKIAALREKNQLALKIMVENEELLELYSNTELRKKAVISAGEVSCKSTVYKSEEEYKWRKQKKARRILVDDFIKDAHSRSMASHNRFSILEDYQEFDKQLVTITNTFVSSGITPELFKDKMRYKAIHNKKEELRNQCADLELSKPEKSKVFNNLARGYNSRAYKDYNVMDSYILIKLMTACALTRWNPNKDLLRGIGIKRCQTKYIKEQVKSLARSFNKGYQDID